MGSSPHIWLSCGELSVQLAILWGIMYIVGSPVGNSLHSRMSYGEFSAHLAVLWGIICTVGCPLGNSVHSWLSCGEFHDRFLQMGTRIRETKGENQKTPRRRYILCISVENTSWCTLTCHKKRQNIY
jgi:hypothetical protein